MTTMYPQQAESTARIAESLASYDVPLLRVPELVDGIPLSPTELIGQLVSHTDPRIRATLIPLFLRHPDWNEYVGEVLKSADVDSAETLTHFYTAAVYLQQLWRGSLSIYLGQQPSLPNLFAEKYTHIAPPQQHFGELGLRQLAAHYKNISNDSWLTLYQSMLELLLSELRLHHVSPN